MYLVLLYIVIGSFQVMSAPKRFFHEDLKPALKRCWEEDKAQSGAFSNDQLKKADKLKLRSIIFCALDGHNILDKTSNFSKIEVDYMKGSEKMMIESCAESLTATNGDHKGLEICKCYYKKFGGTREVHGGIPKTFGQERSPISLVAASPSPQSPLEEPILGGRRIAEESGRVALIRVYVTET